MYLERVEERRQYYPESLEDIRKTGNFWSRGLRQDEHFWEAVAELGERDFLALARAGHDELYERAKLHDSLYNRILWQFSRVGPELKIVYPQDRYSPVESQSHYFMYGIWPRGRNRPAKWCELYLKSVQEDLEMHPTYGQAKTLRRACILKSASVMDVRSQAMSSSDRRRLGEASEYVRGQTYRESLVQMYANGLLQHYGLSDRPDAIVHLTAKGIQAPKLALLALFSEYPDMTGMIVGSPYFETNKFLGRLKQHGTQIPELTRLRFDDKSIESIVMSAAQAGKPTVMIVEPIESYSSMKTHDIRLVVELAAKYFKDEVPFFLVMDMTTLAGMFQVFEKAQEIIGGSNVNIVTSQSLLKYFNLGLDLTQLGAVIAQGPMFAADSPLREKFISIYNLYNMDPDISAISLMPPVDKDYMTYRARTIERNALHMAAQIMYGCEGIPDLTVHYPGFAEQAQNTIEFVGFMGGYFFVDLPRGVVERVMQLIENEQPDQFGYIESGVSFGFDHTRVQRMGQSLRVVPGTEDICHNYFIGYNLRRMIKRAIENTGN